MESKIKEEQSKVAKTIGGEIIISDEEEDDEEEEEVHNLATDNTFDNNELMLKSKSKTSVNDNVMSRQ